MGVKAVREVPIVGGKAARNQVCSFWLAGKCNRNPCRFMHREPIKSQSEKLPHKRQSRNMTWKNPKYCAPKSEDKGTVNKSLQNKAPPVNDEHMDHQPDVHGSAVAMPKTNKESIGYTMLAKLQEHNKAVSGICFPSSSNMLYSASKDGSLREWDCNSGKCIGSVNFEGEVRCVITDGPWLFSGLNNAIKVWNLDTHAEFTLNGIDGVICSMNTDHDHLFSGTEGGSILVWKWRVDSQPVSILKGHNGPISSLVVGCENRLYSGSHDFTIKVWDRQNFQCLQTLYGHTGGVWAQVGSGPCNIETIYEIKDDHVINALGGIHDAKDNPILLCSYMDQSVRLYDLPLFAEHARIIFEHRLQVLHVAGVK